MVILKAFDSVNRLTVEENPRNSWHPNHTCFHYDIIKQESPVKRIWPGNLPYGQGGDKVVCSLSSILIRLNWHVKLHRRKATVNVDKKENNMDPKEHP